MQTPKGRTHTNDTLVYTIVCDNFLHAVQIINDITPLAEQAQHHPDIMLKNYKELTITLTTHDAGCTVTHKDTQLAHQINMLKK